MRATFDVLPASILVAWYKQAGICNGWPLQQKKQLLVLLLWYWHLKSVNKLKGEGSLQYWTALIKSSATLPFNGILSKVNSI